MRVGLYARVSTYDQHTLPLQIEALRTYIHHRRWKIVIEIEDIESGAKERPKREILLQAARKREIDVILVWRLDRWGRSSGDLILTLQELNDLKVGFISLTEALDFTTATGRAMASLLAVFSQFEREILRERVKAGIAHARKKGTSHGRPKSAAFNIQVVKELFKNGYSKSEIAKKVGISRTSVRRFLQNSTSNM
ncbi:recombinase family protein [Candidatus Paracaedibacter symbiosus]|uniref:recombinase family protein n=1 Tax=Candidatus Paracaedibacter symbiosus TaxID=244582 RepID=UPI0005099AC6|nr:recombinase family protein [Candidatus Paracaedibacter symbiosus]